MIVNSFGLYVTRTVHDHGAGELGGWGEGWGWGWGWGWGEGWGWGWGWGGW